MPIRWPARLFAAGLLLSLSHPVAAACPAWPTAEHGAAVLERALAQEAGCRDDAVFLAELGRLLNEQRRYDEAADRLERALMLQPGLPAAQLEYIVALTGSGELASARNLLQSLLADPDLPAAVRPLLAEARNKLAATPWLTRATLGVAVGHDSNLLGAPDLQRLDLTLADGLLTLPLSESYRARAGRFVRADLRVDATREDETGVLWQITGQARRRESPDEPASDSTQFDLAADRGDHRDAPGPYLQAAVSRLRSIGGDLFGVAAVGGGIGAPWRRDCHIRGGLDAQRRGYPANRLLDGRYLGGQAQWACRGTIDWALTARIGQDQPESPDRPGGKQRQHDLRLVLHAPLHSGAVRATLEYASLRDERGYSPLLADGNRRRLDRRILRLEYLLPIGQIQWSAGVDYLDQSASIPLFRVRSVAPYLALQHRW